MKAVILAGGLGTRLAEETSLRPKPMVEVGGRPILWHIMKIYAAHGVRDFIICCGFKGYVIKEYFANYQLHMSDVTIDTRKSEIQFDRSYAEDWSVKLVDTGANTMTGGRLGRVGHLLRDEEAFFLTYGDGVADIDIAALAERHRSHGGLATVTAVRPPSRFGLLDMVDDDRVASFAEKPIEDAGWINGGFFVLSPKVLDLIEDDSTIWERSPMERLAESGELHAYRHDGFWQPMDTLRDRTQLEELWSSGKAPWQCWP
ncbi:glucose-1-phosphate cytidylyltransferase [Sphingomonas sp. AOB5]|uniref:glucose-1-phosphate cytidylyltransferase n=1 Tax=Sphingomonas sp. AOB5 TaxID=3034017 RepID=UPI0023F79B9D|nr:glucose-1-phosphate cytidylyltransferase [Sphingomonas sp. AOB5]MDF7774414.1 glucose-1-phosphate cytidylyltransferase [Sphingomonas sp. AOB5]